ncbi:MAG: 1-(5-phosphoribosyl)-5-[(5-phosphoribosylamino)methylideneamino]imidazole-4-carboxamide isomerase [Candidatus Hodarchaeota archaeon]
MFQVIPAIDLREGKCVRLSKGVIGTETVYYEDPVDALKHWISLGTKWIHVVDLDAATGIGNNRDTIKKLISEAGDDAGIQVGGGIRSFEIACMYLDLGVKRIVIGTAAMKDPGLIKKLSEKYSPGRLIVALDHKDEKVQVKGWTEDSGKDIYEMGAVMRENGAGFILFSSVEADGAFTGPDFATTSKMVNSAGIPIFAAGGTRDLKDIKVLRELGASGVIVGKALYEGKIDLENALKLNLE